MKFRQTASGTAIFVSLFCLIHYLHVTRFEVDVVFYSALLDAALATAIGAALLYWAPWCRALGHFEKGLLVLVWLLAGYSFAITVPTVIDRSLSLYILEKLQQRGGAIREDALGYVFTHEYLREHRLVQVRLTEQLVSGTVRIRDGCVVLTPKGDLIATISRFYRLHFLPRKRLLMDRYSDALVNPFKDSEPAADYVCALPPSGTR